MVYSESLVEVYASQTTVLSLSTKFMLNVEITAEATYFADGMIAFLATAMGRYSDLSIKISILASDSSAYESAKLTFGKTICSSPLLRPKVKA